MSKHVAPALRPEVPGAGHGDEGVKDSRRSKSFIVRYSEQAIQHCPAYRLNAMTSYVPLRRADLPRPASSENHHGSSQTGRNRPKSLRHRPRLHGHVGFLRSPRPRESIANIPPRRVDAGSRCSTPAISTASPQRAADPRGARRPQPRQCQISVKSARCATPPAASPCGLPPRVVKNFLAYSLQRLGVDHIDIYRRRGRSGSADRGHVGAIAEMVKAGYVKHIGLSEVGSDTIRRATLCINRRPADRIFADRRGIEDDILGPAVSSASASPPMAYCARSHQRHWSKDRSGAQDFRSMGPRFQGGNLDTNLALVELLRAIAKDIGASVAQVAIAWVLDRARISCRWSARAVANRLAEALGALDVTLTPAHSCGSRQAFPPASRPATLSDAQLAHRTARSGSRRKSSHQLHCLRLPPTPALPASGRGSLPRRVAGGV